MSNPSSAHPSNITQTTEDDYLDSGSLKVKVNQLTQTNWVQWKCHMKNYLNGCGYGCLFCAPSEKEKATTKYQCKNSAGLAILWMTVSEELQGILLENDEFFLTAWNALGDACGKNSTVTIYLSSLVQNLYDVQPFDVTTITKRVALEQSRHDNVATEALFTNNRTQANQGGSKKPSGSNTSNSPPTQGEGDNKKRQHHKKKRREKTGNNTESVSKQLEKLEKLLLNNSLTTSANAMMTRPSLDQNPETEHCSSDSDAYYLLPENMFATDSQDRQTLYPNTGCGCSVVNNLALLTNVISVKKNIRTFGSPVKITHQGTLNLFEYHIAPVSFAPKGPVNLISVLQLVDHGIRPHYKNNNFLIKQQNSIIAAFTRDGNLYSNRNHSQVNLADAIKGRDWHTRVISTWKIYSLNCVYLNHLHRQRIVKYVQKLRSKGHHTKAHCIKQVHHSLKSIQTPLKL
ncbi:hypothetical protein O181_116502 [Austropuccinia psidii MF-1]|uniref:Uncharacterized protein n=1 Tax=Austropuccinia psidii MF-1 TaxID=1389203 RepID=A0A9Q3PYG1_9BASI|nr:hypothetical protein [Austropuccinia psidii MF-1]